MRLRDVTLREGAQMPGADYSVDDRVEAGLALDELGVETIQAGFPVVGEDHANVVGRLAPETDASVSALARARPDDVDTAIEAGADVVDLFVSVSDGMLDHVFNQSREKVWETLADAIGRAEDHGKPVRIGLMDGFRTGAEHVIETAERFPGYNIGLADTVGSRTPAFVSSFLMEIEDGGVDLSRLGVHFHEDLGVAVANTLVAAEHGVGTADVSVAALGERAGNTPVEQLVVAGVQKQHDDFGVERGQVVPICREVLEALGEDIDARRPVIGDEVVQHEAGLHTAVMLDEPWVFEPFDPATFGGSRELIFGELTGRGAARKLLTRADKNPTDAAVSALLETLAERGPLGLDGALELAEGVETSA